MNTLKFATIVFLTLSFFTQPGCKKEDKGGGNSGSEQYTVTTVAGNGIEGYVDGPGNSAQFNLPTNITIDGQGNLYVTDRENYAIRKITPAGMVSTLAGGNGKGYLDGQGSVAKFFFPYDLTVDGQGNIYVVDYRRIRKVTPSGTTTTLAGGETAEITDGEGSAARFSNIISITVDGQGNVYVADGDVFSTVVPKIRKITPSGTVSTFSNDASFNASHLWIGKDGALYSAGSLANNEIVKFSSTGTRTTVRSFPDYAIGLASDQLGNFYFTKGGVFTSSNEGKVFMFDAAGKIIPIAGTGQVGFADGKGNVAVFNHPGALAIDAQGAIYVIDHGNKRIRKISK